MLRVAGVLVLLAGCDSVFGLERDETGRCAHLPGASTFDGDGDGIPEACDPDDTDDATRSVVFELDGTFPPANLTLSGASLISEPGSVDLGSAGPGEVTTLVVEDVTSATVLIDVGFEVLETSIEDRMDDTYAELGVFAVHRSFATTKERGDNCFYGVDTRSGPPVYLEMNEDDIDATTDVTVDGPIKLTRGNLRMRRSPQQVTCTVARDGLATMTNSFQVTKLAAEQGGVAINSDAMRVRIRYLFIAYQPATRP